MYLSPAVIRIFVLASSILLAVACGGGGGGGGEGGSGSKQLKARFNPADLYNALPGDRLLIYRLGETDVYFDGGDIGTVAKRLSVSFELEQHYIMAVERLGIQFLSTIITPKQIDDAIKIGVLDLGDLNAVTTYLVHEIEPNARGKDVVRQNSAVQTSLDRYFNNVESFQELVLFDLLDNTVTKTDRFFSEMANRANAMTAYSALLRHNIENGKTSIQNIQDMVELHKAVLTGSAQVWANASQKIGDSLPSLPDFSIYFAEIGSKILPKLFSRENTNYFVMDEKDLYEIFYDQETAQELFVYDLAVETPYSVISGIILGAGKSDATVYLQRPSASGNQWITQETFSDTNGHFSFEGVQDDDEYRLLTKKAGFVYKAKSLSKAGNLLSVSVEGYEVDDSSLEMSADFMLSIKDKGVTSEKLADDITIRGDLEVEGVTKIGGMDFPNSSTGAAGQFLGMDSSGNISFQNVDGVVIGGTTPAEGSFTDLNSDGSASLNQVEVTELTVTGTANLPTVNISSGTFTGNITNSTISSTTASLTTLGVTSDSELDGDLTVDGTTNLTTDLNVLGSSSIGDTVEDSLTIAANVSGGTAGGNVWFAGNLISSTNLFSLGTANNPWREIYADDLITTSDERMKNKIEPLKYGLSEVMQMKPVSYEWNNKPNRGRTIGLLAQEVETLVEEVVSKSSDEQQTRGVRYQNLVPVLIRAIQDQQEIIRKQEQALESQESRLESLETLIRQPKR